MSADAKPSAEADGVQPWKTVGIAKETRDAVFRALCLPEKGGGAGARVLDFGCGNGRYMEVFSELFPMANIYGVDVDVAEFERLSAKGYHCHALNTEQPSLPFADGFFRYAFSSNVIEHIPKDQYLRYLAEIHRVMAPGGILAIGAPNYPFKRLYDLSTAWRHRRDPALCRYYLYDDPTHVNFVSVCSVERDLRQAGFINIVLNATQLPFQNRCRMMQREGTRHLLRRIGNKFFGSCRKPAGDEA